MIQTEELPRRCRAADRVRAEVSGLPPGRWERRLLTFVQAAIDDSGNEPSQHLYVLAGFVAPAESWIAFSLAWDSALKQHNLDYVKFGEAMRLRGQFDKNKGWDEPRRDIALSEFANIVAKYASGSFSASIKHAEYQRYIRDIAPARVRTLLTDTPYVLLVTRAVIAATSVIVATRIGTECAFYFDTQPGQDIMVQALWPAMTGSIANTPLDLPDGLIKPRILPSPRFESELDWLPLQAADLLAGATRQAMMAGAFPSSLATVGAVPCIPFDLGAEDLKEMGEGLERMMEEFARDNPGIPLFHYDEKTARRDRKRARRGLKPNRQSD